MMRFYYLTNTNDPSTTKLSAGSYVYAWSLDRFSLAVYACSMIRLDGDDYFISYVDCKDKSTFATYLHEVGLISALGAQNIDDLQILLSVTPWYGYQCVTKETIEQLVEDAMSIVYTIDSVVATLINMTALFNIFMPTDFLMEKELLATVLTRIMDYRPILDDDGLRDFVCSRFDVAALIEHLWGFEIGLIPIIPEDLISEEFTKHCTILTKGDCYG